MDDIAEIINAEMPGRRPITDLSNPGDINRKVAEVLALKVPADRIAEIINGLLNAKRQTKHGEVADTRAMEAGAKLWLSYVVGLPIQRQQIEMRQTNNDSEVLLRALQSPATRKALRHALDAAEEESETK